MRTITMRASSFFATLLMLGTLAFSSVNADVVDQPQNPLIALDSAGDFVTVWAAVDETTGNNVIQSSYYLASSQTWSTPATISDPSQNSGNPLLKMNSSGNAIAVWTADTATNTILVGSTLAIGGSWSSNFQISLNSQDVISAPSAMKMEINDSNNIFLIWTAFDPSSGDLNIFGSSALFGGGWTTVNISSP